MFIPKDASRRRQREADLAREERREIVKALSHEQISRRDLFRWGLLGTTGLLAAKHGLSKWAPSAYAAVPTGTPRSPAFGARKFAQAMPRLNLVTDEPLTRNDSEAVFKSPGQLPARRLSYHDEFSRSGGTARINPLMTLNDPGPIEGRPPGEFFAHQRWDEFFPKFGYTLSLGQVKEASRFHPAMPDQEANSVWSYGSRPAGLVANENGSRTGNLTPPLIKARYGEPFICRIYNDLPKLRSNNGGFGRNETSLHFHNAHNGAESDGACNAYHFPGTFYDYHWCISMARHDMEQPKLEDAARKATGPDDGDGLVPVRGDFREIQGTMWFHDHRFFYTAENVHKGNFGMCNIYS